MRCRGHRFILLAVLGSLVLEEPAGATLFSSSDVHRPLVPPRIPKERTYVELFGESPQVRSGRRKVVSARVQFDITEPGHGDPWSSKETLLEALEANPHDPYALCLLGTFYALGHRFDAASATTARSLEEAQGLLQGDKPKTALRFLDDLRQRCGINLARYRLLAGDPKAALQTLRAVPSLEDTKSALVRLAFWWLASLVYAELGEFSNGQSALAEAAAVTREEAGEKWSTSAEYPQYFARRDQVQLYMESMLAWQEGDLERAVTGFAKAVGDWGRFYDARLALGNVRLEAGDLQGALAALRELSEMRITGKMMLPEVVHYSLARVYSEQRETQLAANSLRSAIAMTGDRDCTYFTMASEIPQAAGCDLSTVCSKLDPASCAVPACSGKARDAAKDGAADATLCASLDPRPFAAAHNNLGVLYAESAKGAGAGGSEAWAKALEQLRLARDASSQDSVIWAEATGNLARALLGMGEPEQALAVLEQGLANPAAEMSGLLPVLEALAAAESAASRDRARRLLIEALETQWSNAPPGALRGWLERLRVELEKPPAEEESLLLAWRAARLLDPASPWRGAPLPPLVEALEELRGAVIHDTQIGDAVVGEIEAVCSEPARPETCKLAPALARDGLFLAGLWRLRRGESTEAARDLRGAVALDAQWPLAQRYLKTAASAAGEGGGQEAAPSGDALIGRYRGCAHAFSR